MKGRRAAILARREHEEDKRKVAPFTEASPASPAETNGVNYTATKPVRSIEVSQSPPVGFTAVNLRQPATIVTATATAEVERRPPSANDVMKRPTDDAFSTPVSGNVTIINGRSIKDASPTERAELMKTFLTPSEREAGLTEETVRRASVGGGGTARTQAIHANTDKPRSLSIELPSATSSTVAIPNTPLSLMPQMKPALSDRDDGGPFKAEMVRRMDNMWKGDRVIPPCDRCRRLHMDCLKNLTACMGCTKKHAKCSWKEVVADELEMTEAPPREGRTPSPLRSPDTNIQPLSAGSTIEVNRPGDEMLRNTSIARASSDIAGNKVIISKANARAQSPADGNWSPPPRSETPEERNPEPPSRRVNARPETLEKNPEPPSRRIDIRPETSQERNPEPPSTSTKFDVRPPPLRQQLQDALNGRFPTASPSYANTFSPRVNQKAHDDDDEGDRLQALAARIYRSASQGGHRADRA